MATALNFIDTHAHLTAPDFDADREEMIARAAVSGVTRIISIGAGYGTTSAKKAVELAAQRGNIFASVGIHPHDVSSIDDLSEIVPLAKHPKVVAIGETGLDFFKEYSPRIKQELLFRMHIALAREVQKPLIIHSRDAGEACIRILEEENASSVGGVFHCYQEDAAFAKRLVDINFLFSVPGILTFKKAKVLHDAVKEAPLSQIMLETDAPFLAPVPFRGKRCESSQMIETAKALAQIRGISVAEVALSTTATAEKFFGLPPLS